MKKQWTKPKLITLFRARSDESVLGYCKTIASQTGPTTDHLMCNAQEPDGACTTDYCDASVIS